jgi:hypothetical protein
VSEENAERLRWGFDQTKATGQFMAEFVGPGFVWDMSKFRGWPEEQYYEGIEGGRHDRSAPGQDRRSGEDRLHAPGAPR